MRIHSSQSVRRRSIRCTDRSTNEQASTRQYRKQPWSKKRESDVVGSTFSRLQLSTTSYHHAKQEKNVSQKRRNQRCVETVRRRHARQIIVPRVRYPSEHSCGGCARVSSSNQQKKKKTHSLAAARQCRCAPTGRRCLACPCDTPPWCVASLRGRRLAPPAAPVQTYKLA